MRQKQDRFEKRSDLRHAHSVFRYRHRHKRGVWRAESFQESRSFLFSFGLNDFGQNVGFALLSWFFGRGYKRGNERLLLPRTEAHDNVAIEVERIGFS